jgi:hypothetical protein
MGVSLALVVSCGGGDDDDDDNGGSTEGKGICTYTGCRVLCTYEPTEPEYNEPVTFPHEVQNSEIVTTKDKCNNEDLYEVFEGHIWDGDFFENACPPLDEGYYPADPETGIEFECDSTKYDAA